MRLWDYLPHSFGPKLCEATSVRQGLGLVLPPALAGCRTPLSSPPVRPIFFFSPSPAANLGSSVSPYHEVMRMERRLRSSSEGAGGPRVHGNHRDAVGMEGCGLLKHRNNSSSSKMGSLVGCPATPALSETGFLTRVSRRGP